MATWLIIVGVIIDYIIADPIYSLHPVRLIGRLALFLESKFYSSTKNKLYGGLITAALTLILSTLITYILTTILLKLSPVIGFIAGVFFIYSSIACKDMIKHSREIYKHLQNNNLIMARAATSMIVGRDTRHLSKEEVIRATLESIAENTVDGVLAPLFYACIGAWFFGTVGAACFAVFYRGVNTLDSSFGYKNERYTDFGLISARTDDVCNYIPARLSSLLIPAGAFFSGLNCSKALRISQRDHANHFSPNSGYSEAAFAGALGVQFGGATPYKDKIEERPVIGDRDKEFELEDITRASGLLLNTTLLTAVIITIILFFKNY